MTESEEKLAFAAKLILESDPFAAAFSLFPGEVNVAKALKIGTEWPKDEAVIAEKKRLIATGQDMDLLPSKAELAKALWAKMGTTWDMSDYAKLAKVYAEVRGFIEKPAAANVSVTNVHPKAIEVPTFATDDEWAAVAERQQRALLEVSRSRN